MAKKTECKSKSVTKPAHGEVYDGKVYGASLDQWMTQAEFDAWYNGRSRFLYEDDSP